MRTDGTLPRRRFATASVVLAAVLVTVYVGALLVQPLPTWPAWFREPWSRPRRSLMDGIAGVLRYATGDRQSFDLRVALYFVLTAGVVPWVLMAAGGRWRPGDLGIRRPNRYGWRLLSAGYVVALPFQVWMARGARFADPYLAQLQRDGALAFATFFLVSMAVEHFLIQGVVLAACRPDRRWTSARDEGASGGPALGRVFRWMGLAQRAEGRGAAERLAAFLGLIPSSLPAVLVSGLMFGLVHLGKHPRELLLSLPGGLGVAWMACRSDTWLIPFGLHLATAATTLGLMLWSR